MRKHITFVSILLLTSVLAAGCADLLLEPDGPPDGPGDIDAAPPAAPPDAAMSPDAPPPPPVFNRAADEYDPSNHRVLRSDCIEGTLAALDLTTNESTVVVDTWPWTEPGSRVCVESVVAHSDGRRAFATVLRAFPSGTGGFCSSRDVITIDTATGQVDELVNVYEHCCDDCGDYHAYAAPQIDFVHQRLLYVEHECDPNDVCNSYLAATDFGAMESTRIQPVFLTDCSAYPDEETCWAELETFIPQAMSFDPADPERRVLLLMENRRTHAVTIDSLDIATGERKQRAAVATSWGNFAISNVSDFAVDADRQRVFVSGRGLVGLNELAHVVLSVDLVTGEQRLLYDGRAAADGSVITCPVDVAYDSGQDRVLLVEDLGGFQCAGHVFAVNTDTGELTRLSAGPGIQE